MVQPLGLKNRIKIRRHFQCQNRVNSCRQLGIQQTTYLSVLSNSWFLLNGTFSSKLTQPLEINSELLRAALSRAWSQLLSWLLSCPADRRACENLSEVNSFLTLSGGPELKMSPKPKSVPSRLGPPPQLATLGSKIPIVHQQQEKFQPKMREILARQAKMLAKWAHEKMTWKKILMSWMVILVASKMVLLMLTYKFFTLTSLISLQVSNPFWVFIILYKKAEQWLLSR